MIKLNKERRKRISERLINWYHEFGRDFPWRETNNPYHILLAEKLLQQTSVRNDLLKAYTDLLESFPSVDKLAVAHEEKVFKIIHSLGLHYRAKELVILAREICDRHNGSIPQDFNMLISLPGIGDYTTRALLCFAFGKNVSVVDTNVARILYRIFGIPGPMPANPARKRQLVELADSLIPEGNARDFNFGMLDLGAMICRSRNPACSFCPLKNLCYYGQSAIVESEAAE